MGAGRAFVAVAWIAGAALRSRVAEHVAAAFGIAGVVAVLVSVLAVAAGLRRSLERGVDRDTVMVLRSGAASELLSVIPGPTARIVAELPGWRRDPEGPAVSVELVVVVPVEQGSGRPELSLTLRGVGPPAARVRDSFRLLAGRPLRPGHPELLVGDAASRRFQGLALGDVVSVAGEGWPIVGVFATGGREDSELWGDGPLLQSLYRRGGTVQAIHAKPAEPGDLHRIRQRLRDDPRTAVDAHRQREVYARQADAVTGLLHGLAWLLCGGMGVAAAFAAMDAMAASVETRGAEIAALRAMGLSRGALAAALFGEALVLGVAGGAAGAAAAAVGVDGVEVATFDFQALSQMAFSLEVTPSAIGQGLTLGAALGGVGALLPVRTVLRTAPATGLLT